MAITVVLSGSPGLLSRGPGGPASLRHGPHSSIFSPTDPRLWTPTAQSGVLKVPSAGYWFSLQHLIPNWLELPVHRVILLFYAPVIYTGAFPILTARPGSICNMCNSEKATIFPTENSKEENLYIGISAGNWKQRFYNHRHSFWNPLLRNQTSLSRRFGSLRVKSLTPQIKWRFIKKYSPPGNFSSRCNFFLSIIRYKFTNQLFNKCNELIFKCCHKNKFKFIWKRLIIKNW